jgi:DNA topoisomerase-1
VKLPRRTSKGLETSKPRRFGLRNLEIAPEAVTLDLALDLLTYPKTLGAHPEDGEPVVMNAGPFGWYVSHAGVNASLPKKLLRDERRRAAATARGEPGDADDAADDADAKAWALAAIERADDDDDDDEAEDVFVDEGSRDADAERSGVDARDARDAAALRALFGPVSLAAAVDVLTRKRSKPAGEGRGRWGRKKKGAEEEGKADSVSSARSAAGSSTKATTASAAEKKSAPKPPPPQKKKRAPSSYMLYCAEARASLPAGLKVTEQAKLLGASWKALSDVERTRFEAAAEAAKAALASEAGVEGKPGKKTKKRAPSAYLLYCAEARASLPEGLKVTEQAKLLGAAWKSLEASERSKFERAAAEAKEAATA